MGENIDTGRRKSDNFVNMLYTDQLIQQAVNFSNQRLLDLIKRYFSEKGGVKIARYLTSLYVLRQFKIMTDPTTDHIKAYHPTYQYYKEIGSELLKEYLLKEINLYVTRSNCEEILFLLKCQTYTKKEDIERIQILNLIPLRNGILDINTMILIPNDPKYFFDFQIPIDYEPNIFCPKIDNFFNQIVEKNNVSLLYDIFALSLYRKNILDKYFIFTGEGSNGKSKLIELLTKFIGQENCSSIPLKPLSEDRFAIASLYKKLVNCGADIGSGVIYDSSIIKAVSSCDPVSGQFKFGQIFSFVSYATQIFSANEPPRFLDNSDGGHRRRELIRFPFKFGNELDIQENPNYRKADLELIQKLTIDIELSGVLNKAIIHLKDILSKGQLSQVKSTSMLKKNYTLVSDPVKAFLEEECEEVEYISAERDGVYYKEAEGFIYNDDFYKRYIIFCKKHELYIKSKDFVFKRLRKLEEWGIEFGLNGLIDNRKKSIRGITFKNFSVVTPESADTSLPSLRFGECKQALAEQEGKKRRVAVSPPTPEELVEHPIIETLLYYQNQRKTNPTPIEQLFSTVRDTHDVSEEWLEKELMRLKEEGTVVEPRTGYVQLVTNFHI